MSGENRKDESNAKPHGKPPANEALRIVRAKEGESADLDLDVGDAEPDRRYGREDIADK